MAAKGIHTVIKAMQQVRTSHLYVAGEGDLKESLQTFVQTENITNVTFLGHLDTEKLIPLTILNAFKGEPLPVYGTGENVRDRAVRIAQHGGRTPRCSVGATSAARSRIPPFPVRGPGCPST